MNRVIQLRCEGVICNPQLHHPLRSDSVISLDWHQVLDTIRLSDYRTVRTDNRNWYYVLDPITERLHELRDLAIQNDVQLSIIALSYTHSTVFRNRLDY